MNLKAAWKALWSPKTEHYGKGISLSPPSDELNENYLVDFRNGYMGSFTEGNYITPMEGSIEDINYDPPKKRKIKPITALEELETIPTPFNLLNLDDKIAMLKDKMEYIKQSYTKRELSGIIERLENRKKYVENKKFFDQFQNTTDELINNLLEKYDLVMKDMELFIPEFPKEAMDVIKEYTKKVKKISNKKPVFYVIAENSDFKNKYKKRDPILLVQSPFGFYWQILGAWDKEMLLLTEL